MGDQVGSRPPWNFWGFKLLYLLEMEDLDYIIDATKLEAPLDKQWLQEDLADVRYDYRFRTGPRGRPIKKRIADIRRTLTYLSKAQALLEDDRTEVVSSLVGSIVSMDDRWKTDDGGFTKRYEDVGVKVDKVVHSLDVLSAWLQVCVDRLYQMHFDENKPEKGMSPEKQLFGVDLFEVFKRHFAHDRRWRGKLSRRIPSREHAAAEPEGRQELGGPYFRFACAFAEKAGIRQADGKPYAEETIADFMRARQRRRRRGDCSPGGSDGQDMGGERRK